MVMHIENTELPEQQKLPARLLKHRALEHYVRLFIMVVLVNIVAALDFAVSADSLVSKDSVAFINNMVVANFFVTIIVRQQYIINFLFWLATRAPVTWPLSIRWHLGKVYHHGGMHTGSAVCGTIWFALLLGFITIDYLGADFLRGTEAAGKVSGLTFWLAVTIMAALLVIITMALPEVRKKHHNQFEMVHRFVGWTVLGLFWCMTLSQIADASVAMTVKEMVLSQPSIWLLSIMTFSILLPWLRLRKVPVEISTPSSHVALLKFKYGVTPFAGSSMLSAVHH
nr:hypothetical protein [Veronia nyctiphanis]